MNKGFWLAVLILATFSFFSFNLVRSPAPIGESAGRILKVQGEVLSKAETQDFFVEAKKNQALFPMHKVLTGFDSHAQVQFGRSFSMMPNSSIRLERNEKDYNIHVLSGRVKLEGEDSNNTHFFISGKEVQGPLIDKGALAQLSNISLDSIQLEKPNHTNSKTTAISEKQIHQTFRLHQRFVEKCFIKHYSRTKGQTQSGKVWIRFRVSKSGQLLQPKVRKSDYKDEDFHTCLLEVVSRVQLKNDSGEEVQIEFPIDIQLPQ